MMSRTFENKHFIFKLVKVNEDRLWTSIKTHKVISLCNYY